MPFSIDDNQANVKARRDEAGVVRKVFPKVKVDGHVEQVLAALDKP